MNIIRLLSKKQIAEIWLDSENKTEEEPTCPDCRENLKQDELELPIIKNGLACHNLRCLNNDLFSKDPDELGFYKIIGKSNK